MNLQPSAITVVADSGPPMALGWRDPLSLLGQLFDEVQVPQIGALIEQLRASRQRLSRTAVHAALAAAGEPH